MTGYDTKYMYSRGGGKPSRLDSTFNIRYQGLTSWDGLADILLITSDKLSKQYDMYYTATDENHRHAMLHDDGFFRRLKIERGDTDRLRTLSR